MSLYDYLGLPPTCTPQEIRAAFETRRAALIGARQTARSAAHRAQIEVEWRAIHAARDILGHPLRRVAYDRQRLHPEAPPPPLPPRRVARWRAVALLALATLGLVAPWQEPWLLLLWVSSLLAATGLWLTTMDSPTPRSKP